MAKSARDKSKEATMATGLYFCLNWAKERMDEMDAIVASLEGTASELTVQSRCSGCVDCTAI